MHPGFEIIFLLSTILGSSICQPIISSTFRPPSLPPSLNTILPGGNPFLRDFLSTTTTPFPAFGQLNNGGFGSGVSSGFFSQNKEQQFETQTPTVPQSQNVNPNQYPSQSQNTVQQYSNVQSGQQGFNQGFPSSNIQASNNLPPIFG